MSASIVLFPACRRVGFIRKQAATVASYATASQRRTVDHALGRQRAALLGLGVDPADVEQHVETLRREIAARLPTGRASA